MATDGGEVATNRSPAEKGIINRRRTRKPGEKFDSTQLHRAKDGGKLLKYLSQNDVDVTAFDERGDMPLHAYVRRTDKCKMDCLFTFLINAEYDVDALNKDSDTALHLACKLEDMPCVKALIAFNADVNIFNIRNETPFDLANDMNSVPIMELLKDIGGFDSYRILAECQLANDVDFGLVMDPTVLNMDALNSKLSEIVEKKKVEIGYEVGYKRKGREEADHIYPKTYAEDKMAVIPEGPEPEDDAEYMTPDSSVLMSINKLVNCNTSPSTSDLRSNATGVKENLRLLSSEIQTEHAYKQQAWGDPPRKSRPRCYSPVSPLVVSSNSPSFRSPSPIRRSPRTRSPPMDASPLRTRSPPMDASPLRSPRPHNPISFPRSPMSRSPPLRCSPRANSPLRNSLSKNPIKETDEEREGRLRQEEMARNYKKLYSPSVAEENERVARKEKVKRKDLAVVEQREFLERLAASMCGCLKKLDAGTRDAMEKSLEASLGGEDYAEWLHYKEVGRVKKDGWEQQGAKEMEEAEDGDDVVDLMVDSKEDTAWTHTRNNDTKPPHNDVLKQPDRYYRHSHTSNHLAPPKRVHSDRVPMPAPGASLRHLRFRDIQDMESSVMKSMSSFNPRMSVTESVLGKSVVPQQKYMKMGNKKRGHRILCLDGGGIKGLVQLEILAAIERLAGVLIPKLFDWIVGTSIGGIHTLGMVYKGMKISDLQKMCFKMKDRVFKRQSKLFSTPCDTEALEKLLQEALGSDTLDSKRKPKVMVTAVNKNDTSLSLVFFNNCFKDEYSSQMLWKVARYTSAAPVFFKECDGFVDGGVVANNPCNYGLTRIKMYLRRLKEEQKKRGSECTIITNISCLVSVGCGIFPPEPIGNTDIVDAIKNFSQLSTLPKKIMNTLTTLTSALGRSEDESNVCRIYCEELEIPFYRFSPEVGQLVGTAESDNMKICDSIISAKIMVHKNEGHLEELIRCLGREPVPQRRINPFI